ncbi:MAG: hypothetical protein IMX04_09770 [Candidatus Carbobacillus altaicus]|nr:hypothetical protein [Candidatus Carbobacillus altaicus]
MYAFCGWLNNHETGQTISLERSFEAVLTVRNMLLKTVMLTRPWYHKTLSLPQNAPVSQNAFVSEHASQHQRAAISGERLDDARWLFRLPTHTEDGGETLAIGVVRSGPLTLGMLFPLSASSSDAGDMSGTDHAARLDPLVKHHTYPYPHPYTPAYAQPHMPPTDLHMFWIPRHTVWLGHIPGEGAYRRENRRHPWPTAAELPPVLEDALHHRTEASYWQKLGSNYSLAHWDGKEQMLLLARNPFGYRPLWMSDLPGGLLFATDLTAFLGHPAFTPHLNKTSLAELFVIGPNKSPGYGVLSNVYALLPGHIMMVRGRDQKKHHFPFFTLTISAMSTSFPEDLTRAAETAKEALLMHFDEAIVSAVRPGRSYAALLSGGLDSSAIVARYHQLLPDRPPLFTFSLDYEDNTHYFTANRLQPEEDNVYIEAMVRAFQTEHTRVVVAVDELLDTLERAMWVRGTPGMVDIDAALLLLSERVRETLGSKTYEVFSGEGADELLGGYPWYQEPFQPAEADTFPWYRHLNRRFSFLTRDCAHVLSPRAYARLRLEQALKEVPEMDDRGDEEVTTLLLTYLNLTRWASVLLERKDTMTRLSGLSFHLPFADLKFVQYAWSLPWALKAWQQEAKGLFRYALSGILPDQVRLRKKSPFPKTYHPAFVAGIQKAAEPLLDDATSPLWQWIDRAHVRTYVRNLPQAAPFPWFGQLLGAPQWVYYLVSIDRWLKTVRPTYEGP